MGELELGMLINDRSGHLVEWVRPKNHLKPSQNRFEWQYIEDIHRK